MPQVLQADSVASRTSRFSKFKASWTMHPPPGRGDLLRWSGPGVQWIDASPKDTPRRIRMTRKTWQDLRSEAAVRFSEKSSLVLQEIDVEGGAPERCVVEMAHAVAWQVIAVNPADAVDRPGVPAVAVNALNPAQARTLLAALEGHRFGLPLRTAMLCGLRLSELLGLRWADVDWTHERLLVVQSLDSRHDGVVRFKATKTHRSARPVSVPPGLLDALRDHRALQVERRLLTGDAWQEFDLLFATDVGLPLTSGWMRKEFYRLLEQAGLPRIPLHGLRHTMATLMLAAGEHPKVVSERLGHSNPSFTLNVYGHVIPGMHEGASRRLEASLLELAPS